MLNRRRRSGSAFDVDAAAFFTSAGVTSTTEKSAWNTAVLSFKSANVYTKFNRLYPFIGASLTSAKVCAKTLNVGVPQNAPTYALSTGLTMDGIAQSLGTNFIPGSTGTWEFGGALSVWIENIQLNATGAMIGGNDAGANQDMIFVDLGGIQAILGSNSTGQYSYDEAGGGLFIANRNGGDIGLYQNGSTITEEAVSAGIENQTGLAIGAVQFDGGGSDTCLAGNYLFSFISNTLTAQNRTDIKSIIETFFAAIGRPT